MESNGLRSRPRSVILTILQIPITLSSPSFLAVPCCNQQAMLPRTRILPGLTSRRLFSVSAKMASATPMEDLMRDKVCLTNPIPQSIQGDLDIADTCTVLQITHAFTPSTLIIRNDSHLHAHHAPMQGVTSRETHFQCVITPHYISRICVS